MVAWVTPKTLSPLNSISLGVFALRLPYPRSRCDIAKIPASSSIVAKQAESIRSVMALNVPAEHAFGELRCFDVSDEID